MPDTQPQLSPQLGAQQAANRAALAAWDRITQAHREGRALSAEEACTWFAAAADLWGWRFAMSPEFHSPHLTAHGL